MSRLARWPQADHKKAAAVLKAHPGVWRRVSVYRSRSSAMGIANKIRTGRHFQWYGPAGAFEARIETLGMATAVVARYVGSTK